MLVTVAIVQLNGAGIQTSKNKSASADCGTTASNNTYAILIQCLIDFNPFSSGAYGHNASIVIDRNLVETLQVDQNTRFGKCGEAWIGRMATTTDCKLRLEEIDNND
jgi:hypothetical protein